MQRSLGMEWCVFSLPEDIKTNPRLQCDVLVFSRDKGAGKIPDGSEQQFSNRHVMKR